MSTTSTIRQKNEYLQYLLCYKRNVQVLVVLVRLIRVIILFSLMQSSFHSKVHSVFELSWRWGGPTPHFVLKPSHLVLVSRPQWGRQNPSLLNLIIVCTHSNILGTAVQKPVTRVKNCTEKRKFPDWLRLRRTYTIRCIISCLTALQDLLYLLYKVYIASSSSPRFDLSTLWWHPYQPWPSRSFFLPLHLQYPLSSL